MEKIALITDSSSDIPKSLIDEFNINVLPIRVTFKDADYRDAVEITPEELYAMLPKEVPTTAMPTIGDAWDVLSNLKSQGFTHVIAVTVSPNLSGTHSMLTGLVEKAKQELDLEMAVIASAGISMAIGWLIVRAGEYLNQGLDFLTIKEKVTAQVTDCTGFFTMKVIEYLRKGGRIGRVEGAVAGLLNIKPIIGLTADGTYYPAGKCRGRDKSIQKMIDITVDLVKERPIHLAILHGRSEEEAKSAAEVLKSKLNIHRLTISHANPSMCAHSGPGLLGWAFIPVL